MTTDNHNAWYIFDGTATDRAATGLNLERLARLPDPPPWRRFGDLDEERACSFQADLADIERINAALYLRRPLLITGKPGTGKTTLVYAVARELGLGRVLRWSITSRSTLQDGLYQLHIEPPGRAKLAEIVSAHLFPARRAADVHAREPAERQWRANKTRIDALIDEFLRRRDTNHDELATDQLLNAVSLAMSGVDLVRLIGADDGGVLSTVLTPLSEDRS